MENETRKSIIYEVYTRDFTGEKRVVWFKTREKAEKYIDKHKLNEAWIKGVE